MIVKKAGGKVYGADLQRGQEESQQPVSRLSGLRGREVFLRYGEDLFPEEKDR